MNPKKVVIKIHEDGTFEVITKDKDIIVEIQAPDGSVINAETLDGKVIYRDPNDDLPPNIQKRMGS